MFSLMLPGASVAREAMGQEVLAERVFVDYAAPASCPSKDAFVADVRARTTRFELASAGESVRRFAVELREDASGTVGRLRLVEREGTSREREVVGASCAEVADVLSFVVALSIDPRVVDFAPHVPSPEAAVHSAQPAESPRPRRLWRLLCGMPHHGRSRRRLPPLAPLGQRPSLVPTTRWAPSPGRGGRGHSEPQSACQAERLRT